VIVSNSEFKKAKKILQKAIKDTNKSAIEKDYPKIVAGIPFLENSSFDDIYNAIEHETTEMNDTSPDEAFDALMKTLYTSYGN